MSKKELSFSPPGSPPQGLSIAVTGHRSTNAAFAANSAELERVLQDLLTEIDAAFADKLMTLGKEQRGRLRLHSMLVEGLDQIAAHIALAKSWDLVAPLPFGARLNAAINATPENVDQARALLNSTDANANMVQHKADTINALMDQAHCFELADCDALITDLFLAKLSDPLNMVKAQAYSFAASKRVALAARVMIEQSDLLIGVWDGVSTDFIGGTGHTIELALAMGVPVLWISAQSPMQWQLLQTPEALAGRHAQHEDSGETSRVLNAVLGLVRGVEPAEAQKARPLRFSGELALDVASWHAKSAPIWHGYRKVEAVFGAPSGGMTPVWRNLTQTYEAPDAIASGSSKAQMLACLALPGQSDAFIDQIKSGVLARFAWADGISSYLSDCYRGGMVMNFVFSAFAIIGGIAYLPFATSHHKWMFALFELVLLSAILINTFVGTKLRWHGRWFETRRVAEYLRASPVLLVMGIARPLARWPKGTKTSWPETYVRRVLRAAGLPGIAITPAYLKKALSEILLPYVQEQTRYHRAKADRLARAHHRLDELSNSLFKLAVASVALYLTLKLGGIAHLIDSEIADHFSKLFTFLGVLFPTFGGAFAGIRYFGDFERFASISDATARRLTDLEARIHLLLRAHEQEVTYDYVADIGHTLDDIVFSEIEGWQAVFSGKHISVPV